MIIRTLSSKWGTGSDLSLWYLQFRFVCDRLFTSFNSDDLPLLDWCSCQTASLFFSKGSLLVYVIAIRLLLNHSPSEWFSLYNKECRAMPGTPSVCPYSPPLHRTDPVKARARPRRGRASARRKAACQGNALAGRKA